MTKYLFSGFLVCLFILSGCKPDASTSSSQSESTVPLSLSVSSEVHIIKGATVELSPKYTGYLNPDFIYLSQNDFVASVDEKGVITANREGVTNIYVEITSYDKKHTETATVLVVISERDVSIPD